LCTDTTLKNKDFGLINRKYDTDGAEEQSTTPWQRFERYVRQLNKESGKDVQYKVIYLGRHGQGWHNVAEEKYGSEAWDVSTASIHAVSIVNLGW
jgi:hypothetical protein